LTSQLASRRVAVVGGGIGGLALALALKGSDFEVVIVERDPAPPEIAPEAAFEAWQRPGVPQFRHAHILLARIQTTLRDRHPELLAELLRAGLYLSTVEEVLPASDYAGIEPQPGDADLLHLWGRRATFEYVLRRYVGQLPQVRFIHDARVVGLLGESDAQQLRVRGVELTRDSQHELLPADVVVDASGKYSKAPEWLAAKGVRSEVDSHPSGFVYACRHYRLKDPQAAPPRQHGGGNLDYLGYATFYAEHGHYALTFGCPVEETELVHIIRRPEGFDALCAQLPVLSQWTSQSEAMNKVLGAGRFENRWTRYGAKGGLAVAGFFPLGDSHVETNPMYGRGCASAFVQAEVLGELLQSGADPAQLQRQYRERSRALLQPYFDLSVATDRMYRARAKRRRGQAIPVADRLLNHVYENVWLPAVHQSPLLAREFLKSVQMREASGPWVQLLMLFKMLAIWIKGWFVRATKPPEPQPREEFLRRLSESIRE
jgi:2-polyprenyl-6-methoxyphenol hydroxylase-like FAD-dependent oxidoreductase